MRGSLQAPPFASFPTWVEGATSSPSRQITSGGMGGVATSGVLGSQPLLCSLFTRGQQAEKQLQKGETREETVLREQKGRVTFDVKHSVFSWSYLKDPLSDREK